MGLPEGVHGVVDPRTKAGDRLEREDHARHLRVPEPRRRAAPPSSPRDFVVDWFRAYRRTET